MNASMMQIIPTDPNDIAVLYKLFIANSSIKTMTISRDDSGLPYVQLENGEKGLEIFYPSQPIQIVTSTFEATK